LKEEKIDLKSFDIPVKHFMVNLSYLQTSRILKAYWEKPKPVEKKNAKGNIETVIEIACPNTSPCLDESAYLTE
jgi:hypothetical protein